MKRSYMTPTIEKIEFNYNEQITAASYPSGKCGWDWSNYQSGDTSCITNSWGSAS